VCICSQSDEELVGVESGRGTNLDDLEQTLREKALRSLEEAKQLLSK
jgi:hypothetical protein